MVAKDTAAHGCQSFIELPAELRGVILRYLPPWTLGRAMCTCKQLREEASGAEFWRPHVAALCGADVAEQAGPDVLKFLRLAAFCAQRECRLCHGRLCRREERPGGVAHACECVAKWQQFHLGRRPPLVLCSLDMSRVDDSGSLDWPPMRSAFVEALSSAFEVSIRVAPVLSEDLLSGAHMLVCNMTSAVDPLTPAEQSAMQHFVAGGGIAVLNAFSQWSRNGECNRDVVGWLGVRTRPGSDFGGHTCHGPAVRTEAEAVVHDARFRALLDGPVGGPVRRWCNLGATSYRLADEAARIWGDLSLLTALPPATGGGGGTHPLANAHLHLEPGTPLRGAVLLCSNFHCLVGREGWLGGLLHAYPASAAVPPNDNHAALVNLAASASARALPDNSPWLLGSECWAAGAGGRQFDEPCA